MSVRVVLLEPETGGNIGSIARSMKNFQLNDLWVVNPKTPIDTEARKFAMRGLDILNSARIVRSLRTALRGIDLVVGTSAIAATSTSNLFRSPITPSELAQTIHTTKGKVALVFGSYT
jgi:TrmH family RNA methyltransferase